MVNIFFEEAMQELIDMQNPSIVSILYYRGYNYEAKKLQKVIDIYLQEKENEK